MQIYVIVSVKTARILSSLSQIRLTLDEIYYTISKPLYHNYLTIICYMLVCRYNSSVVFESNEWDAV